MTISRYASPSKFVMPPMAEFCASVSPCTDVDDDDEATALLEFLASTQPCRPTLGSLRPRRLVSLIVERAEP